MLLSFLPTFGNLSVDFFVRSGKFSIEQFALFLSKNKSSVDIEIDRKRDEV